MRARVVQSRSTRGPCALTVNTWGQHGTSTPMLMQLPTHIVLDTGWVMLLQLLCIPCASVCSLTNNL